MENRYNLIDEAWIPMTNVGPVSLRQIFSEPRFIALSGNSVQKITLTKLLLAICQAACTPGSNEEWRELGPQGLASKCLSYLEQWHDQFYLYGTQPFLQMPSIATAELKSYGTVLPEIATGNTTVLNYGQVEHTLTDGDKAILLVGLMSFALGGKKTDNSVILSPAYVGKRNDKGKPSTSKPGPAVAHMGLLHNTLQGKTLWQTLWLNLLTHQQINQCRGYSQGIGTPPWELMPTGEDCAVARLLKMTLMGRLLPLCRFCLLTSAGLHYSEGISHPNYKEGVNDPSVAVSYSGKEPKVLWTNPEKRPWRELTALLGFFAPEQEQDFDCMQLSSGVQRAIESVETFAIWSGGLRVSNNAGEQYVSGSDDLVESAVWLRSSMLGEFWFSQLQQEMSALDELAKGLYGRVLAYFSSQLVDGARPAAKAVHLLWQLCEYDFQSLLSQCTQAQARQELRQRFAGYVQQAYDHYCPRETARQLDTWTRYSPNFYKYLQ